MPTPDDVRRIALALPKTAEHRTSGCRPSRRGGIDLAKVTSAQLGGPIELAWHKAPKRLAAAYEQGR